MVKELPQEIILNIISRLPIKSIFDCMIVCKCWCTLISNPFLFKSNSVYFVLYNEKSTRFAILDHENDHSLQRYYTRYSQDQISLMKPCFPIRWPPLGGFTAILASCNGMVCFSQSGHDCDIYNRIYVCNPIIGEHVAIPEFTSIARSHYAFGFCPLINQYKVLRSLLNFQAEIYTLGSREWRRIGDFPEMIRNVLKPVHPVCFEGVFHWICGDLDSTETQSILTFSLAGEEFGTATLPPIEYDEKIFMLGCMDGCLIATAGCYGNLSWGMSVWVRKEGFWSRSWHIHDDTEWLGHPDVRGYGLQFTVPVAKSPQGWILLKKGNKLYSYDPKGGDGIHHFIPDKHTQPRWSTTGLLPYIATLVSPKELMKGYDVV